MPKKDDCRPFFGAFSNKPLQQHHGTNGEVVAVLVAAECTCSLQVLEVLSIRTLIYVLRSMRSTTPSFLPYTWLTVRRFSCTLTELSFHLYWPPFNRPTATTILFMCPLRHNGPWTICILNLRNWK
jgi:hypothetical protein